MTSSSLLPPDLQSSPALLLDDAADENAVKQVIVHPVVLFHILDHHTRRQESTGRVIGTLLGRRLDNSTVEVTNSFSVPHAERGDEVAIGKDFNRTMLGLHLRSNHKEVVVGWYASASAGGNTPLIADTSSLIHDFYSGETDEGDPVHLVVDTRLENDVLSIRAYKSTPIVVQGETLGNLFHELELSLRSNEPEAICLGEMIKQTNKTEAKEEKQEEATATDSPDDLEVSMEKLHSLLETALEYVQQVVDGKVPADSVLGRQIADTLEAVPRIRPEVFDQLFHDSLQDLLMVTYLSNITRTQLTIAENLNASLGVV